MLEKTEKEMNHETSEERKTEIREGQKGVSNRKRTDECESTPMRMRRSREEFYRQKREPKKDIQRE